MTGVASATRGAKNGPNNDFHPDLNLTLMCPECRINPPDLVERFSEGDVVCGNCGLVLGDRVVDTRSEWRTFSNDDQGNDDPSRVGDAGNPLMDDNQLDTMIAQTHVPGGAGGGSNIGRDLSRTQNKTAHAKKNNELSEAFSRISQLCEAYSLPRVVQDSAKQAYKLSYEDKKLKNKSKESVMAAAIFLACRHSNVARTFKEVSVLTSVPINEIGKTFNIMKNLLQELPVQNGMPVSAAKLSSPLAGAGIGGGAMGSDTPLGQTTAQDLIARFCSYLGLSSQVTRAAEYIARHMKEQGTLAGRSPTSIAAAVIYFASGIFGEPQTASRIAERAGVAEGTIKNSYKLMWKAREKLVDPKWIESGKAKMENAPKI